MADGPLGGGGDRGAGPASRTRSPAAAAGPTGRAGAGTRARRSPVPAAEVARRSLTPGRGLPALGALTAGVDAGSVLVGRGLSRRRRRQVDQAVRLQARQAASRYRLVYDARGPKVRLGVLWFGVALAALALGPSAVAPLYALVAAVAALQTAYARRRAPAGPVRPVAGLVALGLPLAALAGSRAVGAALLVAVAGSLAAGQAVPAPRPARAGASEAASSRGREPAAVARVAPVEVAAATLGSGMFVGLAGAAVVLTRQAGLAGAVVLLVLVSAYEVGDYLVGTGAGNAVEGPAAGIIGLLVVTFTVSLLRPPPFHDSGAVWALGVATAVLCPLGQVLASGLLPTGGTFAPALRRLDSLLLVAPLWAVVLVTKVGLG